MRAALVVGLLLLAGALYNVFGPEPDFAEAAAGSAIAAILVGVFLFARAAQRNDEALLEWLLSNARAIQEGGARYGPSLITSSTVLTQYQLAVSFLIISFKLPSRLYVEGDSAPLHIPALLSLLTLLLGWWGIPWGPVYTVQVLARNVRGGVRQTAGELLSSLSA